MPVSSLAPVKQPREPPLSLFLGSPSLNTSHLTLKNVSPTQSQDEAGLNVPDVPFLRHESSLSHQIPFRNHNGQDDSEQDSPMTEDHYSRYDREKDGIWKGADKSDDAQWAEMQSTLKDFEISNANGKHVFGSQHSTALEGLRTAQIELAKAWARSEIEEATEGLDDLKKGFPTMRNNLGVDGKPAKSTEASGTKGGGAKEEDFEADIIIARKRREANDRYFQRMNHSVLDVVSRLEEVASSMNSVAQESKVIWEDSDPDRNRTSANETETK
ncbi:hypothetical protein GcM3_212011 [Golovinomyces cichoracearum]|uniref:Uncharacterized protein n=1 Tax=Golovinomyces cichoracearum TaxID=62708 RepID=A0A420H9K6_9PEZI|nr:hypothetical protein GcM3_212011 [Golovinomyces cichoracearum]